MLDAKRAKETAEMEEEERRQKAFFEERSKNENHLNNLDETDLEL